jgi:hypothetical protein
MKKFDGLVRCDGRVYVDWRCLELKHDNPWQSGHFGIKTQEVIRRH